MRRAMTKIKRFYRLLLQLSSGRSLILIISSVMPIVVMIGFALFLAIKYSYLLELSIAIAISTLAVSLPLFILHSSKNSPEKSVESDTVSQQSDSLVKASVDWSDKELAIWQQSKCYARSWLKQDIDWKDLDRAGLEVLEFVATKFNKKTLDFSIPEGLKLFEEISQRYQAVVVQHIPGIEYLKLSHIKSGINLYDQYGELGKNVFKAAIWANHAKNLYLNPLKVVSDLSREQLTASMTKGVVSDMQYAAKQALLDEVAAVAIDLYSGRFSLEESEVQSSNIAKLDKQRVATDLESVRIVMVGQISSGKSSIINLLMQQFAAEVDVLPSTNSVTVYRTKVNEVEINVVDSQGLDGKESTEQQILAEMIQADLVLWVLKANQSARDLDKQLNEKFELYYADAKNISRKKPVVITVLNQVDRLNPTQEWQPPYDLIKPTAAKANTINQALHYNQKLLHCELILPLSISVDKPHFGVDELKQALSDKITAAYNVQRNRQRKEAMDRGVSLKQQLTRAAKMSKKVTKKVLPKALKSMMPNLIDRLKNK